MIPYKLTANLADETLFIACPALGIHNVNRLKKMRNMIAILTPALWRRTFETIYDLLNVFTFSKIVTEVELSYRRYPNIITEDLKFCKVGFR